MNKLPKEIYVEEISDEPIYYTNAEECATPGQTVTLAVYKLVGTVEVSTQMKQEVIVKKAPKAKKKSTKVDEPESVKVVLEKEEFTHTERNPLLQEMRVTATS